MSPYRGLRVSSYQPTSIMAPHHHNECSFIVVMHGLYRERIQSSEHDHGEGDVLFYPAFNTHSQQFGPKGARKIVFTPDNAWLEYLAESKIRLDCACHVHSTTSTQLGSRLLRELLDPDDFAQIACEGILLEVVADFARTAVKTQTGAPPLWLRQALELIHEREGAQLAMARIAEKVGRHPVHLAREFRRFFKMSIGEYQREIRTRRAEELLRRSRLDLTEIALRCGFASHSHLCRSFKAAFGLTPSEYRSRNR